MVLFGTIMDKTVTVHGLLQPALVHLSGCSSRITLGITATPLSRRAQSTPRMAVDGCSDTTRSMRVSRPITALKAEAVAVAAVQWRYTTTLSRATSTAQSAVPVVVRY